jgi:hypothetical protein
MHLGAKAGADLEGVICKLLKNMVREDSGPFPSVMNSPIRPRANSRRCSFSANSSGQELFVRSQIRSVILVLLDCHRLGPLALYTDGLKSFAGLV